MKRCFLEVIDRFAWDADSSEDTVKSEQLECLNCVDSQQCYQFSMAKYLVKIHSQLENVNRLLEKEERDNGCEWEILDEEYPFEDN
jgi:hypothetical protein